MFYVSIETKILSGGLKDICEFLKENNGNKLYILNLFRHILFECAYIINYMR